MHPSYPNIDWSLVRLMVQAIWKGYWYIVVPFGICAGLETLLTKYKIFFVYVSESTRERIAGPLPENLSRELVSVEKSKARRAVA